MYRVVREFCDLQDAAGTKSGMVYHQYRPGDVYPRKGLNPSEGRIAELAGPDNAQGQPLIEPVNPAPPEDPTAGETRPRRKSGRKASADK